VKESLVVTPDPAWHHDPHLSLGLLALGALGEEQESTVRRHLLTCEPCRARSLQFAQVVGALSMVTAGDARGLVAEFGAVAPARRTLPVRRLRLRHPSVTLVGVGAALMGLALIVGLLIGAQLDRVVPRSPASASLTVTGHDTASGVGLSVFVTDRGDGVTINATVLGLPPGIGYQLYAVTTGGRIHVAGRWLGSEQVHTVTADLPVQASALAFFTVARLDGSPVVSAQIRHASPVPARPR
jgi:predicted anti-sigma-YlaC factor YlaD